MDDKVVYLFRSHPPRRDEPIESGEHPKRVEPVGPVEGAEAEGASPTTDTPNQHRLSNDPEDFVAEFLKRERITIRYNGEITRESPAGLSGVQVKLHRKKVARKMLLDILRLERKRQGVKIDIGDLQAALRMRMRAAQDDRKVAIWEAINEPLSQDQRAAAEALLRQIAETRFADDPDLVIAVLLEIIYQVKQKMLGHEVNHHLVLVITSNRGGGGKTTFVRLFLNPVEELRRRTSIDAVADVRNVELWSSYVLFIDEMDRAKPDQRAKLKERVTADEWQNRVLGSGEMDVVSQNATIIGTSNLTIEEMFADESGARRFAELYFSEEAPSAEAMALVDEADWLAIWRLVDADDPMGPLDRLGQREALRARQEAARKKDVVETWALSFDPTTEAFAAGAVDGAMTSTALYQHVFRPWETAMTGRSVTSHDKWGKRMGVLARTLNERFPWEKVERRDGNWWSYVPPKP